MKKTLLIVSCILIAYATAFAQNIDDKINRKPVTNILSLPDNDPSRAQCDEDTLLYTYLKEVFEQAPTFYLDPMIGPNRSWSQAFKLNGAISVVAIQFWGNVEDAVNAAQTITAKAYLYSINASNMPLAKIDSATVVVGTTQKLYTAVFNSPVTISSNYAVVIRNPSSTDTLGVVMNNASAATYGEGLAWRRLATGVWNTATAYWGQDAEPVIAPIVKYNVTANNAITSDTTVCLGTPMTFTDMSSPLGVVGHRMYNYRVFAAYWGNSIEDSTYTWNMGNGTNKYTQNTSYTYPAVGSFTSALTVMGGLYKRCLDTKIRTITINDTAKAAFTINMGSSPTIAFTNTSTGAVSYSWDFGDGSPANMGTNPNHTYTAVGTYTVTLTATSASCNVNVKKQVLAIVTIGIYVNSMEDIKVYINPATGMLFIDNVINKTQVEVLNILGKVVYSLEFSSPSSSVDLSTFSSGIYFVRASVGNKNIIKKIAIR